MSRVDPPSRAAPVAAAPRRAAQGAGFALPTGAGSAPGTAPPAAPPAPSALALLLALQEAPADPRQRRQAALRRGQAAIAALRQVQAWLLHGTPPAETLTALATAADALDDGGDPALAALLAEVRLRARIALLQAGGS